MGTEKRERQKANKRAREAELEAAAARERRVRFLRNVVLLVIAIIVVAFLMSALSGCSKDEPETVGVKTTGSTAAGPATGADGCPPEDGVDRPVIDFSAPPPDDCIDPAKTYTATFSTTKGDVVVDLDTAKTPGTTNAFVFLARYGFYDGTDLFRTEAQTGIIQGGSPHTQDNTDPGAGFSIKDEALPFTADDYGPGTLAMARTAAPDSASGQFFFLANQGGRYLGDPAQLGPDAGSYVVFGKVTKGLDVLEAIAALDDGGSTPREKVTVTKVTVAES